MIRFEQNRTKPPLFNADNILLSSFNSLPHDTDYLNFLHKGISKNSKNSFSLQDKVGVRGLLQILINKR